MMVLMKVLKGVMVAAHLDPFIITCKLKPDRKTGKLQRPFLLCALHAYACVRAASRLQLSKGMRAHLILLTDPTAGKVARFVLCWLADESEIANARQFEMADLYLRNCLVPSNLRHLHVAHFGHIGKHRQ